MADDLEKKEIKKGLTRRQFMASVGSAAAVSAVAGKASAAAAKEDVATGAVKTAKVSLLVNGRRHRLMVETRWSLLYVLRDRLGLMGTKEGCGRGECGACTVLMDGKPRYACMTLAVEADDGAAITTIEGLMEGDTLGPVQQAFAEEDAFQCGFCTPGQIMAAEGLLRADPNPTTEEIRMRMGGNLCRCGSYAHIVNAVHRAAGLKKERRG